MDSTGRPHISYRFNSHLWHAVYGAFWAPIFTSVPDDGQAGRSYSYVPEFNEDVTILSQSTNAAFLFWDNDGYYGTPGLDDYGIYWMNITALSVAGSLTSYQNETFQIDTRWNKTSTDLAPITFGSPDSSLALDSNGNPHYLFVNDDGDLQYTHWNGAQWVHDIRNSTASSFGKVHITVGEIWGVQIAYHADGKLIYQQQDGESWRPIITVANAEPIAMALLNDDEKAVLAYKEGAHIRLAVKTFGLGDFFNYHTVDSSDLALQTMAVNSTDVIHVLSVYSDGSIWELRQHYNASGTWHHNVVDSAPGATGTTAIGLSASLVFDSEDVPHMVTVKDNRPIPYGTLILTVLLGTERR